MSERLIKERKKKFSQEHVRVVCCSREQINANDNKVELLRPCFFTPPPLLFPPYNYCTSYVSLFQQAKHRRSLSVCSWRKLCPGGRRAADWQPLSHTTGSTDGTVSSGWSCRDSAATGNLPGASQSQPHAGGIVCKFTHFKDRDTFLCFFTVFSMSGTQCFTYCTAMTCAAV